MEVGKLNHPGKGLKRRSCGGRGREARIAALLSLLLLLVPLPLSGQLLFDWPIRSEVVPDALQTGAAAVLWNPGGIAADAGSPREIWLVHLDGPDATTLSGLAAAAVLDLPLLGRGAIAVRHLGVPDIPRTTTSPLLNQGNIDVGEDLFVLALARNLRGVGGVGGAVRYLQANVGESRSQWALDLGILFELPLPLSPRVAGVLRGAGGEAQFSTGVDLVLPVHPFAVHTLSLGWGITADSPDGFLEQRLSLSGRWAEGLQLGAGLSLHERDEEWTPLWMAAYDFGRYTVGIVREPLPNDFGAAHYFRLSVAFGNEEEP